MDVGGRWLPDGVRVERVGASGVRLRGGAHDGREFDTIAALRRFIDVEYPDLQPPRGSRS